MAVERLSPTVERSGQGSRAQDSGTDSLNCHAKKERDQYSSEERADERRAASKVYMGNAAARLMGDCYGGQFGKGATYLSVGETMWPLALLGTIPVEMLGSSGQSDILLAHRPSSCRQTKTERYSERGAEEKEKRSPGRKGGAH